MEIKPDTQKQTDEELLSTLKELHAYEKKNLRVNRIRLVVSAVCLLLAIVTAVFVFVRVGTLTDNLNNASGVITATAEKINNLADELEKLNIAELSRSLGNIVRISEETITEIQKASGGLDALVKDADEAMQHINSVDFENLNNGIQRLNDILKPVADFFNIFK